VGLGGGDGGGGEVLFLRTEREILEGIDGGRRGRTGVGTGWLMVWLMEDGSQ